MPNPIINRRTGGAIIVPPSPGSVVATAWAAQVVTNGGALPSQNSQTAIGSFVDALMSAGVWTKLNFINVVAPDSITAALTPLAQGCTKVLWTTVGTIVLDGTNGVNGLRRNAGGTDYVELFDGSTSLLSTGIPSVNSASVSMYRFKNTNLTTSFDFGSLDGASDSFILNSFYSGIGSQAYIGDGTLTATQGVSPGNGYYCGSRTTSSRLDLYFASSGTAHSSVANNTGANTKTLPALHSLPLLNLNNNGVYGSSSDSTISYISGGNSLSAADSLAQFNAVQALRTAFGGGFV